MLAHTQQLPGGQPIHPALSSQISPHANAMLVKFKISLINTISVKYLISYPSFLFLKLTNVKNKTRNKFSTNIVNPTSLLINLP
ncbi:hypothetical protein, partial [Candidatus Kryptobacter tengchongensis]|uniref:hypothetical protein n=1 Tax=Kryptobacter tengchongensis TaxID=1643429 RepID=UPI001F34703F